MKDTGLVLEGGGMRGAYTAGVLDFFHDEGIQFPFVVGASAGACNGSSYVAGQRGRNYEVMVEYGDHPEYISYKRMFTKRQLFGMDFIFDKLPNDLVPFDYESFQTKKADFVVGTTNLETGEPLFYDHFPTRESLLKVMRASSSLPLIAPSIMYDGKQLMDGGISDPIPVGPSIKHGNTKHVFVLTRNDGYLKGKMKLGWYFNRKYRQFPMFAKSLINRHERYNEKLKEVKRMEQAGEAFVLRPMKPLQVSRIERNRDRLHQLYTQGYEEAQCQADQLADFLQT
ncbi:patatin family protein [Halobacillus halophilus]|uniref:patatin-like phospholipase family protein n=1 Tax=Halobacillus halophilus TaxID=1570 RepID=UPI001CD4F9FD|nr:patatin family protein [Halobacillus halophilus]MCA1012605.1 patatin family protein [Halobacillus halophilus]